MIARGVILIGPRGAGKSTVGPLLATLLGLPFEDADEHVERRTGRSVAELMKDGTFRDREREVLPALMAGAPAVLAVGGGAILWEGFRRASAGWRVVWLDAHPRILAQRIAGDDRVRPSLTGRPPEEEMAQVVAERAPLYRAAAWRRVATDTSDPETVAALVHVLLREEGDASSPGAE